jgi:hypothetical protein
VPTLARIQGNSSLAQVHCGGVLVQPWLDCTKRCPALAAISGPVQMNTFIISRCQTVVILQDVQLPSHYTLENGAH